MTDGLKHPTHRLVIGHRDIRLSRLHHPIEQHLEILLLRISEEGRMLRITAVHEQRRDVLKVLGEGLARPATIDVGINAKNSP